MHTSKQLLSFHVVPGPQGVDPALQRLRSLGLTQLRLERGGQWIRVIATREQVAHLLGRPRPTEHKRRRVGPIERPVETIAADKIETPEHLQDVIAQIVFPVPPDYLRSSEPR